MLCVILVRSNPEDDQYYRLVLGDTANLAASPLRAADPTVVVVHGFNSNGFTSWPVRAKTGAWWLCLFLIYQAGGKK